MESGAPPQFTYHHSLITRFKNVLGAVGAGFIVVAFCLLLLWHDPLLFWNDDYALSILPVFADVARGWSEGHLPLLSPSSWVCGNLAGEFQYGTFSVFVNAAVVLIWKFPLSFPQQAAGLSITHLFVLGMGGYMFARGRKLSPPLSFMIALVAALNGWVICWGATDWFGALAAFTWFPWAWWATERALDPLRGRWRFLWPAPFVYLLVTGGFPYTVLMLGLLVAWLSLKSFAGTKNLISILPMLCGVALGFGLSAPAWLALLDYVHGSARQTQESAAHYQWLVPPAVLPAFILPNWTVNWADFSTRSLPHTATELACGLVPPLALLGGLIRLGRALVRPIKWELGLLVLVLIISMLPSANVFRWSFRWLPFLHLILALCAAESLRRWNGVPSHRGLVGIGAVTLAIVACLFLGTQGKYAFPFVWITLALVVSWAVLENLRLPRLRAWAPAIITFASLLATYLCIPPNCGVPKYNLTQELTKPAPLDPRRLYLSIYPQPEHAYRVEKNAGPLGEVVRPGSTSMWSGVRFINGYSPIRPAGVTREFNFGIHGEIDFPIAKRLVESEAEAEGEMARLGIDGLIIAREMKLTPPTGEWDLAYTSAEGAVYHRRSPPLAPVRSVTEIDSRPNEQFAEATVSRISNERNRLLAEVTVPANGPPALLTFSRPFFNGYRATIGDVPLKVDSYRGLIPVIEVPAGINGRLTMVYRPRWLLWGCAMSILCAAFCLSGVVTAAVTGGRERLT